MKNKSSYYVLILLINLITFLFLEGAARFFIGDQTNLFPRYHTSKVYNGFEIRSIRPNKAYKHKSIDGEWSFETNSKGFRNNKEFDYKKDPKKIRIITVGDSTTQGYECAQDLTYSATTERYLQHRGFETEVLNTGVSGFSNAEELVLIREELVKYSPDYIVLGFFANDFQDNIKSSIYKLNEENELIENKKSHIPGVRIQDFIYSIPGISFLSENSYLYSFMFNRAWNYAKYKMYTYNKKKSEPDYALPTKKTFNNYEIRLAHKLIREIYSVVKANNSKLILVDIPFPEGLKGAQSSMKNEFKELLEEGLDYDYLVTSDWTEQFEGGSVLHVPHGHRHISSFSHQVIGSKIGEVISKDLSKSK